MSLTMHFRPFPVLSLFAFPMLGALLWLGVWQIQRASWKSELIALWEESAEAEPALLHTALCGVDGSPEGRIVDAQDVAGRAQGPITLRMFGHSATGAAGWRLLTPVSAPDCLSGEVMLAETGFEPLPSAIAVARPEGAPKRYRVAEWPKPGRFAPANDPQRNDWHRFDRAEMAAALAGAQLSADWYLEATGGIPAYLSQTPPSRHIGYAVTWFGMAVAFVLIYGAFHARAGRLRFRRQDDPPR